MAGTGTSGKRCWHKRIILVVRNRAQEEGELGATMAWTRDVDSLDDPGLRGSLGRRGWTETQPHDCVLHG